MLLARPAEEHVQVCTVRLISASRCWILLAEVIQVCECSKVGDALGFLRNAELDRKIADLLEGAELKNLNSASKRTVSVVPLLLRRLNLGSL
jgi:hypothetical protein